MLSFSLNYIVQAFVLNKCAIAKSSRVECGLHQRPIGFWLKMLQVLFSHFKDQVFTSSWTTSTLVKNKQSKSLLIICRVGQIILMLIPLAQQLDMLSSENQWCNISCEQILHLGSKWHGQTYWSTCYTKLSTLHRMYFSQWYQISVVACMEATSRWGLPSQAKIPSGGWVY